MKTHGSVYRAFDSNGEALYVGMTTDLRQRLSTHASRSPWWSLAHRIEHDPPQPLADAFRSECDQIAALRPRFNKNAGVTCWNGPAEPDPEAWRAMYERGMTVEEIALEVGTNTPAVRRHLAAAGTVMRRPGQRVGLKARRPANSRQSSGGPAVMRVAFAGARGVHRRRGGRVRV